MNLRDAYKNAVADFEGGNAVMLVSPPGMGKSSIVPKFGQWLADFYQGQDVGIAIVFMATSSPISFTGLPWKGEKVVTYKGQEHRYTVTDPAIPTWYMARDIRTGEVRPANLFDKVLCVIEEWGQGDADTKRAGAELVLNGGAGNYYLPPGSPRLCLSNNDARDGVTKEFDFFINRRGRYNIDPDVDVWIEDFADRPYTLAGRTWQVLGVTKAWAISNPLVIFEKKPDQQGEWCSPRSITAVDRYAQVCASQNNGEIPMNNSAFMEGVSGKIGMPAAQSYINHLQFTLELPSYADVVKDPAGTPLPTRPDLQLLMAYELAGRCQRPDLGPVLQYMSKPGMPKDMGVTFISALLRKDYRGIMQEPPMQAWVQANQNMVSMIAALAN
jgi:hypothetical protein